MIRPRKYAPLSTSGNGSHGQGHRGSSVPPVTDTQRGGLPTAPLQVAKMMLRYSRTDRPSHPDENALDLDGTLAKY